MIRQSSLAAGLALILAVAAGQGAARAEVFELVSLTNSVWRFNQTSNLDGISWTAPAYNDSAWQSGPGLLAFDSNAEIAPLIRTTLDDPRTPVAGVAGHADYFRIHFDWPHPPSNVTLRFACRLDDCAVLYLNGTMLTNIGVSAPVTFSSYGRAAIGGGSEASVDEEFTLASAALVTGDNVLAVEVHQLSSSSSDIVWGARVTGEIDTFLPLLGSTVPAAGAVVRSLDSVVVSFSESVRNVTADDLLANGIAATNLLALSTSQYRFQFASIGTGLVQVAFASGHGITDLAANPFAGASWTFVVDPAAGPLGPVVDDFSRPHDFLAAGLVGTIWEGLYTGAGDIQGGNPGGGLGYTLVADANLTRPGALTVQSTQTDWEGGNNDGFYLYKTVAGDFQAQVQIVAFDLISYNCGGLMARVPRLSSGGPGEDFMAWFRFDEFNIANYLRTVDNGNTDNRWPANYPNTNYFIRLERVGDTFNFFEKGAESDAWPTTPAMTVTRADLAGLPLQVGIMQGSFSGNTPMFQFANFRLEGAGVNLAGEPGPATDLNFTNAGGTALKISWTPGTNSSGSLVLMRAGKAISAQPADGITYAPAAVYGAGEDLGGGNYAVYAGGGSSVTVTNLSGGVNYHVAVYSFTGGGSGVNYRLDSPAAAFRTGPGSLESLALAGPTNMVPGAYGQARVTAFYDNGTSADVTPACVFASTAPEIVRVETGGQLQAQSLGTATIMANYQGRLVSNTVSVIEPPAPGLVHRYSFDSNANDLAGSAHGVLQGGAAVVTGALVLDGAGAYLDLPDNLVTGYTAVTIEAWVLNQDSGGWARVWDFGNAAGVNMLLTWPSGDGQLRAVYNRGEGEQQVNATTPPNNQMTHIVFTQDGATRVARLYVDGVLAGQNTSFTLTPAAIGPMANDWLGRSQYPDPNFHGRIDEFRIYDAALTASQVEENYLAGPDSPPGDGLVRILRQPADVTVAENEPATFSALVQGLPPVDFQWYKNGIPATGATASRFTFLPALQDDGAVIHLQASNAVGSSNFVVRSGNALLHVLADTNPPTLVRATSAGSLRVAVLFSELVTAASATKLGHYSLLGPNGPVGLHGATLGPDWRTVNLACDPLALGATYTLVVSGVQDRAAAANAIAANSSIQFAAVSFELQDIGQSSLISRIELTQGGVNLFAGGAGFTGTSDQFTLGYQTFTGDFDVAVRLESLGLSDAWARAGIMARDGLGTNDAYAATWTTPGPAGCFFQARTVDNATNTAVGGAFPVNYPHTWLRLKRDGNTFSGFAGLNGQTWAPLGAATIAMSSAIQVGLAACANNSTGTVIAAFRDFGAASGVVVTNAPLPFEPMAPSSRKTGLVISEIMYNPPDAWSTGSLEFIEFHNPDLFFEDLTGYRLEGDIEYAFPAGTLLPSGGYLIVARNPAALAAHYQISGALGPFSGNLPNDGGTIRLVNDVGGWVLEVKYASDHPWPVAADGAGHSLVLRRPSHGEADPRAWGISDVVGGSPGRGDGWGAEPLRGVVINEFLANSDAAGTEDFIELYNAGEHSADLSGAWLSDTAGVHPYRIPDGTVLEPGGFAHFSQGELGFALSSQGERIFLVNAARTRVLDALRFGPQAPNVSRGRMPDGAPFWDECAQATPGGRNSVRLPRQLVINEIMYHPPAGREEDEYVELFNRGASSVDAGLWRLSGGISGTVPVGTVVPPGGYLVVAKNVTNLLTRYRDLSPANAVGNFSGSLKNSGERLKLEMPLLDIVTNAGGVVVTNLSYVTVSELAYGTGGRWGRWSDGGGSSLELTDPDADPQFAPNWADSDESGKAPWTTVDFTGVLDNGMSAGNGTPNRFEFFLQGAGECLVDELQCISGSGTNLIANAGFESGLQGWAFQGTHRLSFLEANSAFAGSKSLHVVATDRGDAGPNRIRTGIPTMATGINGTLRAKVRWLSGTRHILFRVRGNWIEAATAMELPATPGTPGLPNSRRVDNAGPAIVETMHQPVLPATNQPIVVSARVRDPDGVARVRLLYRVDPGTTYAEVQMADDGTGGDALAGDGVYSGIIPGQAAGTMVAFYITASDEAPVPAASRFPADAPARECLVRFGEVQPHGGMGAYRIWMTRARVDAWNARERNSNEPLDCTFVYGNCRAIYNAGALYSGSPWHTANHPYNGPLGNLCDYELNFQPDEGFAGATDFVLNGQGFAQNFFENDLTAQAEYTAYWLGRKLGLGYDHKRAVRVFFNGQQRGMLYFDHQQPNNEIVSQYFRDDDQGSLHKIEDWFEFDDGGNGFDIITATLQNFTTTGGTKKAARYRWTWRPRASGDAPNDFNDLFNLVDAVNGLSGDLVAATSAVMDTEQWMRHFAFQHAIGNWDTYGYNRGKNCFAYKPTRGPWRLLIWDVDIVLGKGSDGPSTPLLSTGGSEPVIQNLYNKPVFARAFWRAIADLANGPMQAPNYQPRLRDRFAAYRALGLPVEDPASVANWMDARRTYMLTQVPASTFDVTNSIRTTNTMVTLAGAAPVTVADITVNGTAWPVTWTDVTHWRLTLPVGSGTNVYSVIGRDRLGGIVAGASGQVTVISTAPAPDAPAGNVVINEIMFQPAVPGAAYVELFNRSATTPFDLSGWHFNGLAYDFPAGTFLQPRSYLVLARDRAAFAAAYSAGIPVLDSFTGALQADGETLTLIQRGADTNREVVVDKVKYEGRAPWPAGTTNGASLQLVDAAQDNSRVCNWSDSMGWRFVSFTGVPAGSTLYVYLDAPGEVYLDDMALVAGSQPAMGSNYLVNAGFEQPLTQGWRMLGNLTNSAVTTSVKRSGNSSARLVFGAPAGTAVRFYQPVPGLTAGATYTLSFWYLPATGTNGLTAWFSTAYQIRALLSPVAPTPGTNNAVAATLPPIPPLWINEVQPVNQTGPLDAAGEREPWIELYNAGTNAVSLAGICLSGDYANLSAWSFPTNAVIGPGEFKLIIADGQTNQSTASEWHAGFRLTPTNGSVALSRRRAEAVDVLDYVNYAALLPDYSYGSIPDGQPFDRARMFRGSPGRSNLEALPWPPLQINEWMAANAGSILDPADYAADDWFEIYNPTPLPVDLAGWALTDKPGASNRFEIPSGYWIPPLGYTMVWADNQPEQNLAGSPELHVNFKLERSGESIALYAPDGRLVDWVVFGPQTAGFSSGRHPDGGTNISVLSLASPRGVNAAPPRSPEVAGFQVSGSGILLTIQGTPGFYYQLEYTPDLNPPAWSPLGAPQAAVTNKLVLTDAPAGVNQRYYRVRRIP